MTKPLHHFDKRILARSIRKGLVSEEDYQSDLSALPDSADNIAPPEPEEGSVEAAAAEGPGPRSSLAADSFEDAAAKPPEESGSGDEPS